MKRPEIKVTIPDSLKLKLVQDWESVTKSQQLVSLPRTPTVSEICIKFKQECSSSKKGYREDKKEDVLNEVIEGIKLYFDRALGNLLLYRFERPQYMEIKQEKPDLRMSDIYGAEHLLRLFGTLNM